MAQLDKLPNIVLILTDQHRADFLGCYGHPSVRTPNIDALSRSGTRFDRCYVASPVCMPNRASIMTGRMPSAHRARMNGIPLSLRENTFVELLRLRGYRTALIGKSHLQNMIDIPPFVSTRKEPRGWQPPNVANEAVRPVPDDDYGQELPSRWNRAEPYRVQTPFYGFEEAILCPGHGDQVGGHYFQWLRSVCGDPERLRGPANALPHGFVCPDAWRTAVPEEWYPTRYIENETVGYITRHATNHVGAPFFLAMSFPDPHHPFTPPGRYWSMYDPNDQVLPASFHHQDDALPQVLWARRERDRRDGKDHYSAFAASEREAREAIALTAGLVTMIDDAVGRVVNTLRETGLLENTVIVFSSDHGDYLGDHGLLLKGPLHLQSLIRVPLIWSDPKSRRNGRVSGALASSIDISATILDRAGIDPYNGMQGKSLLPVMETSVARHRESVLIEEDAQKAHFGFSEAPRIRTLITDRYRLSIYGRSGHGELFDLENDSDELENRFAAREYAGTRAGLMEELAFAEMEAADRSPMPVYLA
jgi:arylsulfatase A-like enzyme